MMWRLTIDYLPQSDSGPRFRAVGSFPDHLAQAAFPGSLAAPTAIGTFAIDYQWSGRCARRFHAANVRPRGNTTSAHLPDSPAFLSHAYKEDR